MVETKNSEKCEDCKCGDCHCHSRPCCGGWHKHLWLRWLLGLIILGIVFCIGFKIGEFKASFENEWFGGFGGAGYGYRMMQGRSGNMFYYGPGMMYQTPSTNQAAPATPAAPSTTKK